MHRLVQRRREKGSIETRKQTTFRHRVLPPTQEERLALIGRPGCHVGGIAGGVAHYAALSTLSRTIGRLGIHGQKNVHADEQHRPDVAAARRHWQEAQPLRDARQFVVLDESGVTTDLLRRYGSSPPR